MPDRHKHRPITWRPSPGDRARLLAYAERVKLPVRRVIALAVAQFLDRESGDSTTPAETPQAETPQPAETPQQAKVETPRKRQPRPKASAEDEPEVFLPRCSIKGWCARHGTWHGKR